MTTPVRQLAEEKHFISGATRSPEPRSGMHHDTDGEALKDGLHPYCESIHWIVFGRAYSQLGVDIAS